MSPRAVVTGGAGFLGSHLCRTLVDAGWEVVAVDDCSTGSARNVEDLEGRGFRLVVADVTDGLEIDGRVDLVAHLASPASPRAYLARPIETLAVGAVGTRHALELARRDGARFLLTSTSEVYGDPLEHPQREGYWGNVNPVGPRSVYDEAKRYAEALAMAFHRHHGLDVKIARIFNTYGPGLDGRDGRMVSSFLGHALRGEALVVHGDGRQTRSFCYVDDLVAGLVALGASGFVGPMNLGNPEEHTVLEVAELVLEVVGGSGLVFEPRPVDDPSRRCPDIGLARRELGWEPAVPLREGLLRLADWYRARAGLRSPGTPGTPGTPGS